MRIGIKLRREDPTWGPYIERLSQAADTDVIYGNIPEQYHPEWEVLITTNVSEEELDRMPSLKRIYLFKTGMDGLPLDKLAERGIQVFPSHANADVIAEHAVALALCLLHRVAEFDADLRNDIWFSDGKNYYWKSISELNSGILGYGAIGSGLCKKLAGLTSRIKVLNRSGKYDGNAVPAKNIDELISWCDILFICIPKTNETAGLIDAEILDRMKGKYIVNISRAEICDEEALFNALKSGQLAGYASDVWYLGPDKTDRTKKAKAASYDFSGLKNVVMSPHCASHEFGAHERYISDAVEQCLRCIKGEL